MTFATAQLYQGFFCNTDSKSQMIKILPRTGTNTCSLYNSLTTFWSGEGMLLNACILNTCLLFISTALWKRDQELALPVQTDIDKRCINNYPANRVIMSSAVWVCGG